jgi:hypothetical protein
MLTSPSRSARAPPRRPCPLRALRAALPRATAVPATMARVYASPEGSSWVAANSGEALGKKFCCPLARR